MYLTLRDPFREFERLNGGFFKADVNVSSAIENSAWMPEVHLTELNDRYDLKMELAGVDPAKVSVEIKEEILTISGEKTDTEKSAKKKAVYLSEIRSGKFKRSFRLKAVNGSKILASSKHGVLHLELPKKAESVSQSVRIEIN